MLQFTSSLANLKVDMATRYDSASVNSDNAMKLCGDVRRMPSQQLILMIVTNMRMSATQNISRCVVAHARAPSW